MTEKPFRVTEMLLELQQEHTNDKKDMIFSKRNKLEIKNLEAFCKRLSFFNKISSVANVIISDKYFKVKHLCLRGAT